MSVDTTQFYKKYIVPYTWDGSVRIDNGWGDKSKLNKILSSNETISLDKQDFYLYPITDVKETPITLPDGSLFFTQEHSNPRYRLAFKGEKSWDYVLNALMLIKEAGTSYVIELESFFTEGSDLDNTKDVFKLIIKGTYNTNPVVDIQKGKWVPDFSIVETIAEWEEIWKANDKN